MQHARRLWSRRILVISRRTRCQICVQLQGCLYMGGVCGVCVEWAYVCMNRYYSCTQTRGTQKKTQMRQRGRPTCMQQFRTRETQNHQSFQLREKLVLSCSRSTREGDFFLQILIIRIQTLLLALETVEIILNEQSDSLCKGQIVREFLQ